MCTAVRQSQPIMEGKNKMEKTALIGDLLRGEQTFSTDMKRWRRVLLILFLPSLMVWGFVTYQWSAEHLSRREVGLYINYLQAKVGALSDKTGLFNQSRVKVLSRSGKSREMKSSVLLRSSAFMRDIGDIETKVMPGLVRATLLSLVMLLLTLSGLRHWGRRKKKHAICAVNTSCVPKPLENSSPDKNPEEPSN